MVGVMKLQSHAGIPRRASESYFHGVATSAPTLWYDLFDHDDFIIRGGAFSPGGLFCVTIYVVFFSVSLGGEA